MMLEQAQHSVLGTAILQGITPDVAEALSVLDEAMFEDYRLKDVFNALTGLYRHDIVVDVSSVVSRCKFPDAYEFVTSMCASVTVSRQVMAYANQIRRLTKSVWVANELADMAEALRNDNLKADKFSQRLAELSHEIDFRSAYKEPRFMKDLAKGYCDTLDARMKGDKNAIGLDIGLDMPINRTDLVVVGAPPGMGKTALMMYILRFVAEQGEMALVYSLEMEDMQIFEREVSCAGNVSLKFLKDPAGIKYGDYMSEYQRDTTMNNAMRGVKEAGEKQIAIDDSAGITIQGIKAKTRRFLENHPKCSIIAIDYLTLIQMPNGETRNISISEVTRSLKLMAKDLKKPVILLSQMNRNALREKREPQNHDLNESGSIEQNADKIVFPWRPEVFDEDSVWKGYAKVLKTKVRDGELGVHVLKFDNGNFYESDKDYEHFKQAEEAREAKKKQPKDQTYAGRFNG